jgi:hypothetical protein
MSADEAWDDWINVFIEKILKILGTESLKRQLESSENDLIYNRTVSKIIGGKQSYYGNRAQNSALKPNSIGRIYSESLMGRKDVGVIRSSLKNN